MGGGGLRMHQLVKLSQWLAKIHQDRNQCP